MLRSSLLTVHNNHSKVCNNRPMAMHLNPLTKAKVATTNKTQRAGIVTINDKLLIIHL